MGVRRGRWGLCCDSVFGRYCFGSGRCGSARSNIQAGCTRAHTAAVPVLWDHVQLAKSAELRSAPSSSLDFLPHLKPLSVFWFVGTLVYSHLCQSYSFRKSERELCVFCLEMLKIITPAIQFIRVMCSALKWPKKRKIINQYSIGGKHC